MARIASMALLALVAAGCGGGDPCAGSHCPNDSQPTPAQYQQCVNSHNANRNTACYLPSLNVELCNQANTICSSNGTTDFSASLSSINNNCKAARDSLTCCLLGLTTCK